MYCWRSLAGVTGSSYVQPAGLPLRCRAARGLVCLSLSLTHTRGGEFIYLFPPLMSQVQQFKTPQPLVTRHKAWHNEASDSFHEIRDFLSTSRLAGRGWGSSGLIRTSCTPETASPTPFPFAALRKKTTFDWLQCDKQEQHASAIT